MSEQVIMPKEDWQEILDTVRYGTEKSAPLRSAEVASAVGGILAEEDGILDGSVEYYKNSRLTSIRSYAFNSYKNILRVEFPNLTSVAAYAFQGCTSLEKADFSSLTLIGTFAFYRNSGLKTLIIRTNTLCELESTAALGGTAIANGEGYVYVPAALIDEYKQATNWTMYADNIRAIEDYPEITGETI